MHIICGLGVSPGIIKGKPITFKQYQTSSTEIDQDERLILLVEDLSFETITELIIEGNIVGIIAERGCICSHVATLSREAKLPCIVNVREFKSLSDCKVIQIDGTSGEIEVQNDK